MMIVLRFLVAMWVTILGLWIGVSIIGASAVAARCIFWEEPWPK